MVVSIWPKMPSNLGHRHFGFMMPGMDGLRMLSHAEAEYEVVVIMLPRRRPKRKDYRKKGENRAYDYRQTLHYGVADARWGPLKLVLRKKLSYLQSSLFRRYAAMRIMFKDKKLPICTQGVIKQVFCLITWTSHLKRNNHESSWLWLFKQFDCIRCMSAT